MTIVFLAFPGVAFGQDARCNVDAVDAFRAARENGYDFRLLSSTGVTCELHEATIILTAPAGAGARCRYLILGERPPENGWRIRDIVLSGEAASVSNYRPEVVRVVNGSQRTSTVPAPGYVVNIAAGRGQTNTVSISRVSLRGPDCARVLTAFGS